MIHALSVFVEGLTLEAEIGLYDHERGRTQPLSVDIELTLTPAVAHGIHGTVNYETLAAKARALAACGHVELVETFAEQLAADCLDHPRAVRVRIRVRKPEAIGGAQAAGVELTASRS
ncbi:dihydroneopterin aldolase [Caulobacter sp. S45]|uniref:dihydroneopterin aldolase n=1 Tax=Caulobacter sp. S45 TaxID=1641861 RepID=UPI0015756E0F|nr:dihydroneopterin aldolase [Caulobacter sp. S45]